MTIRPAAVGLLSAAALGYEILLTRLMAVVTWHQAAALVISLALLGIGASGTALAFLKPRLSRAPGTAFALLAVAFGLLAPLAFALAQRLPLNPLEFIWDFNQQLYLLAVYVLLALPFFAAGLAIGLALSTSGGSVGRVYRADLIGAGLGALGIVAALYLVSPEAALRGLGLVGLTAALVTHFRTAVPLVAAAIAIFLMPGLEPRPSPYKGLSLALNAPDARVVARASGPLGELAVVESPTVPFRHAPGLSLMAPAGPPKQLGLFIDADAMTPLTPDLGDGAWLDWQVTALPYHLLDRPRVLVLGAGGGQAVIEALALGAGRVDAVELDRNVVDLAGAYYPDAAIHVAEARAFVEAADERWDLIQLSLVDSFGGAAGGASSAAPSPLYTVEAVGALIDRLAPGGLVAITRWIAGPPRDLAKLLATAAVALEQRGIDPAASLALVHGWNAGTLLIKDGPLTADDVTRLDRFAAERSFDFAWPPSGRAPANILAGQPLGEVARALLGPERDAFIAGYPFAIAPATDDRPFFHDFFRWRLVPELYVQREQGALALLDSGYLFALAALVQAVPLSLVLILLPLAFRRGAAGAGRWPVAAFFLAIGLGFLAVEIAFIHRLTLFLGHPLAAIAVVLAGFLVAAGIGAGVAPRRRAFLPLAAVMVAAVAVLLLLLLPAVTQAAAGWTLAAKVPLALALIAPLGFAMGLPFPLALARVNETAPGLVPWAWAINGCASVIGAVGANLLAMELGFTGLTLVAAALYLLASLAGWKLRH